MRPAVASGRFRGGAGGGAAYSAPPDSLAGFKWPTSNAREGEGERKRGGEGNGGTGGEGPSCLSVAPRVKKARSATGSSTEHSLTDSLFHQYRSTMKIASTPLDLSVGPAMKITLTASISPHKTCHIQMHSQLPSKLILMYKVGLGLGHSGRSVRQMTLRILKSMAPVTSSYYCSVRYQVKLHYHVQFKTGNISDP